MSRLMRLRLAALAVLCALAACTAGGSELVPDPVEPDPVPPPVGTLGWGTVPALNLTV